jgi:hypothetical protein
MPCKFGVHLGWFSEFACHPILFLCKEVIRRGHMVVFVHLQALGGIVSWEAKPVELFQHVLFKALRSLQVWCWQCSLWDLAVP